MRYRTLIIAAVIICFYWPSFGQNAGFDFNRIGVGDKVPGGLPLVNLVNFPKSDATISDFKGKLLILDYWFTGCPACIDSWPKLMELQRKFEGKIQIMLVNHMQNKAIVESFMNARNRMENVRFSIPSVTGDTILYKVFPPSGYPSVVWVDPNGIYSASTTGDDLNEENIQAVLNNIDLGAKSLTDNTTQINLRRPLFIDGNGGSGQQMLFYSTVSSYSDKVKDGHFLMSADPSGYVIATTHKSILDLISRAYCDGPFKDRIMVDHVRFPSTRIELLVKDPARLLFTEANGKPTRNNLFTYQLISYEPRNIEQLKEIMRDDIRKYFNLNMQWHRTRKKCLVLTAKDTTLISTFGDHNARPLYGYTENKDMYVANVSVDNFLGYLVEFVGGIYRNFGGYPLIDETGFNGGLDLVFKGVSPINSREIFSDYKKLNSVLREYKMQFDLEEREVDVLVISDVEGP